VTRRPYIESVIVYTTVRILVPFVLTLGLFVILHGAESPGGGFQGGGIVASAVFMLAFAFGFHPTRDWVGEDPVRALVGGGVLLFGSIAVAGLVLGGDVLAYTGFPVEAKYVGELVEVAIGLVVAGVLTGLFFLLWAGIEELAGAGDEEPTEEGAP
jgi:multicomponent Na+:H+ antiporter subunit B